jgi:hypothetical protein
MRVAEKLDWKGLGTVRMKFRNGGNQRVTKILGNSFKLRFFWPICEILHNWKYILALCIVVNVKDKAIPLQAWTGL